MHNSEGEGEKVCSSVGCGINRPRRIKEPPWWRLSRTQRKNNVEIVLVI